MELQQNIPLAPFTTLGIGGRARWFITARTEADVSDAISFARERSLPVFVLGGGSNLLIADGGFEGLVVHIALRGIEQQREPSGGSNLLIADGGFDGLVLHIDLRGIERQCEPFGGKVLLQVAAGESWDALVQFAVEHDLAGIECLAGIPGTVGGTPVQNVGAYGQEVSETIQTLRCFDMETRTFAEMSNFDCGFAYRTSLLNTSQRGRYVVTRVDFLLTPNAAPKLEYADLRKRFAEGAKPSLREVAEAVRQIRRGKSMVIDAADPNSRSAGSFFRNPVVDRAMLPRVAEAAGMPPDQIPHWTVAEGCVKLPAAWLLERAGFVRGYTMGNAGISSRHTLALINRGGATAHDIAALRDRIIDTVQMRFGIRLEQEPVSVGDPAPISPSECKP